MLHPRKSPPASPLDRPGMGDAGRARFQGPSHAAPLFRQHRLTARDHLTIGMSGDQIIRLAPHRRCAVAGTRARDRRFQSVAGHVGSPGRDRATGRRPGFRGTPEALGEPTTRQPGLELPTQGRRCIERASHGFVVEAIAAGRAVRRQHPVRLLVELDSERADGLPGTPSRANAGAVWCPTAGFPGGLPIRV